MCVRGNKVLKKKVKVNDVQLKVLLITSQWYDVNVKVSASKTSDSSLYWDWRKYQETISIFNNYI